MLFAITHGTKRHGRDPIHTLKVRQQIVRARDYLPSDLWRVICGTGRRFEQTLELVRSVLRRKLHVEYCEYLGSAVTIDRGMVVLPLGTIIDPKHYRPTSDQIGFNIFRWLGSLPERTLLVTGARFMSLLTQVEDLVDGAAYKICTTTGGAKRLDV